jgi:hypothetical protein
MVELNDSTLTSKPAPLRLLPRRCWTGLHPFALYRAGSWTASGSLVAAVRHRSGYR